MKTILSFIVCIVAVSSTASAREIVGKELDLYKDAIVAAVDSSYNCINEQGENRYYFTPALLMNSIRDADSAEITEGSQPLLSFYRTGEETKTAFRIISDESYISITEIQFDIMQLKIVNNGNLLNPSITHEFQVVQTSYCSAKN